MLRIVGGTLRGRHLRTPEGRSTRPTSARVREALFDVITHHPTLGVELPGARVADLYAGSGALGIEALSRGAASALFVERDRRAVTLLRRNLKDLGLTDQSEVWSREVERAAPALRALPAFDLLLLDPPYADREALVAALTALAPAQRLTNGGLLVLEQAVGTLPLELPGLAPPMERRWGATVALFYTKSAGPPANQGHE